MAPAFLTTTKSEKPTLITKLHCILSPKKPKTPPPPLPFLTIPPPTAGLARVFHHVDVDGDGKISPSELQCCLRKMVGDELGDEEAIAVFELHDSDGDGMLGLEDFVRLVNEMEEEEEEEDGKSLREAFRVYEMEGEGCITPKSLRTTLERMGEWKTLEECEVMIMRYDVDGDGVLSFDEFKMMML